MPRSPTPRYHGTNRSAGMGLWIAGGLGLLVIPLTVGLVAWHAVSVDRRPVPEPSPPIASGEVRSDRQVASVSGDVKNDQPEPASSISSGAPASDEPHQGRADGPRPVEAIRPGGDDPRTGDRSARPGLEDSNVESPASSVVPADREASADDSRSAAGPAVPERDDRAAAATQTTKPGERSPIREAELARRAEAIQAMRDQLQRELREFGGGSFERWSRSLEAFRQSFRPNRGSGRHEFQFLNAELWAIRADRYDRQEPGQAPFESIVRMNEFLREHDIDLIYMPIPDKVMVYPDLISDQVQRGTPVAVAYKRLLLDLAEAGVEVIDLEAAFRRWRQEHQDRYWLYQAFDTHWNNRGAQIAAAEVARRLERYDFVQQAQRQPRRFRSAPGTLTPGTDMSGRHRERILEDPAYRLPARMVMLPDGSTYEDVQRSPVIMTADSFGRIWRDEGAQTSAQLAYEINLPVTLLHGTGSGPRIPMMLIQEGTDYLEGRRVFIWTGVCRQLARGAWTVLPQDPYSRMDFASSGNGEDDDLLDD